MKLAWDQTGQRFYENGVDRGVLYLPDDSGAYTEGYAWNGLTTVTEKPTGAESTKQYADNGVYLNLTSVEQFGGTIEAFTYPDEFAQCDGSAVPTAGVTIGQQPRKAFGFAYRTQIGNDLVGTDLGYKLHLVYGATAAPSEKAYATVNDSPTALSFSWEITTIPVEVEGFKPTASMTIDSTQVDAGSLATLEGFLYGTTGTDPSLPLPADVVAIFSGSVSTVTPTKPTQAADVITIPTVAGVEYTINGEVVTGTVTITANTLVTAYPTTGHKFPIPTDNDWLFIFS